MNKSVLTDLVVFQNKKIRRIWHQNEWVFSVVAPQRAELGGNGVLAPVRPVKQASKHLFIVTLFLILSCSLPARADIVTGLVGWWKLDGGAQDSSGFGHHGTMVNGTPITDRFNRANAAMSFNQTGDIDCGSGWNLDANFTVSLWIKSNQYVQTKGILTKTDSGGYAVTRGFSITNISNPEYVYVWISNGVSWLSRSINLNTYSWTHLTVVRNGTNILTYKNGALFSTDSIASLGSINGSQNLFLAKGNSGFWQGSLDDVRIYNRALSATDVTELYNNGGPTTIRNAVIRNAVIR